MDYFAYVSHTKVDQLYEAAAPGESDTLVERETRQRSVEATASAGLSLAGIAKLFSGEIGYGSGIGVERERTISVGYVEKLRIVLTAVAADLGEIPSLEACLQTSAFAPYVHHVGEFRVVEPLDGSDDPPPDRVATLQCAVEDRSLLLDCSLRFFSAADDHGVLRLHSGNFAFFVHGMPLRLETVFVFLGETENEVRGTPLYLTVRAADADPRGII